MCKGDPAPAHTLHCSYRTPWPLVHINWEGTPCWTCSSIMFIIHDDGLHHAGRRSPCTRAIPMMPARYLCVHWNTHNILKDNHAACLSF